MSTLEIYRGASLIDGKPIVVLATGFDRPSVNRKTGEVVQLSIIRADVMPLEALASRDDASVCGDCALRPTRGKFSGRGCYVSFNLLSTLGKTMHAAPRLWGPAAVRDLFKDFCIRVGTYGDPAAVPVTYWRAVLQDDWLGYTHQWRTCDQSLQEYFMASCETRVQADEAQAKGWRTFRIAPEPMDGEIECPAVRHGVICKRCRLCSGLGRRHGANITIPAHGPSRRHVETLTQENPS